MVVVGRIGVEIPNNWMIFLRGAFFVKFCGKVSTAKNSIVKNKINIVFNVQM